jgi:glycosyltransferase involved in cell wall biosynthesis
MNWQPNVEGINWFLSKVWDPIFKNSGEIELTIAGKDMPKSFFDLQEKNLIVKGWINDAKTFISSKNVMIVPLKSGSGLRVKILEAMAYGKCVITTSIGAEGINYQDQVNLIIANSVLEFESKINQLIDNPEKIKEIGKNARKLIEEQYNQLLLNKKIPHFLESIHE